MWNDIVLHTSPTYSSKHVHFVITHAWLSISNRCKFLCYQTVAVVWFGLKILGCWGNRGLIWWFLLCLVGSSFVHILSRLQADRHGDYSQRFRVLGFLCQPLAMRNFSWKKQRVILIHVTDVHLLRDMLLRIQNVWCGLQDTRGKMVWTIAILRWKEHDQSQRETIFVPKCSAHALQFCNRGGGGELAT